jgi:hypothetical protein
MSSGHEALRSTARYDGIHKELRPEIDAVGTVPIVLRDLSLPLHSVYPGPSSLARTAAGIEVLNEPGPWSGFGCGRMPKAQNGNDDVIPQVRGK